MSDPPDDRGLTPDPGRIRSLAAEFEAEGRADMAALLRFVANEVEVLGLAGPSAAAPALPGAEPDGRE